MREWEKQHPVRIRRTAVLQVPDDTELRGSVMVCCHRSRQSYTRVPITQLLKRGWLPMPNIDDVTKTIFHIFHKHLAMSAEFYYAADAMVRVFPGRPKRCARGQSEVRLLILCCTFRFGQTDVTRWQSTAVAEMEPGLRVTGHRVSDFGRVGSGHGSVCQTRRLTRFWVLTCALIVALFLQSNTISAN